MTHPGNSTNSSSNFSSPDGVEASNSLQLTKLSSVLNGLEGGAQMMQRHINETMGLIRAGTYRIDPIQLSRKIVGEALRIM